MLLSSLFVILLSPQALAATIYVSPHGSDQQDGSSRHPLRTLKQAQQAVRRILAKNAQEAVTVQIADGQYILDQPLNFTAADSGNAGRTVYWKASGSNVTISGGTKIKGWSPTSNNGIYVANVAKGTVSRNLYINGKAANYARRQINRKDFTFSNTSMSWNTPTYDWIANITGIEKTEIRAVNSFTDRYAPIASVSNRQLVMRQFAWRNQVIGYDTIPQPNADFGLYIQNSLDLLQDGGQYFLDSAAGKVYYKPQPGEDMSKADTWLGRLEALIAVGGTYDKPAHDISFQGFNFAHTTWLKPGLGYGYVDQQTGGYIGENTTYPQFEATRPRWYQMPSAIQISAAYNIEISGGTYTQLGSGGVGIGNDPNAHVSGVGLGTKNIAIKDGYFTQVMGNSITAGGVLAAAHHPPDARMINSEIHITGNIFFNVSSLFTSTVPIFVSYIQYSTILNNDLYSIPYSGICHGYGWGSNDAGGSAEYIRRGLYDYQPLYDTPTTSQNNLISGNLVHQHGLSHTDLGAIYTLSKSPSTLISENYALDSKFFGMYTDEGSNSFTIKNNTFLTDGPWYAPNEGCLTCGVNTANNTLIDNFGKVGGDRVNAPNGSGRFNNTFIRNFAVPDLSQVGVEGQRVAYRAGVLPARRGSRPVSNTPTPDAHLALQFPSNFAGGDIIANISNFDDGKLTKVSFTATINNGYKIKAAKLPNTIPSNSFSLASWKLSGSGCTAPIFTLSVKYTNSRTGVQNTISINGTLPGNAPKQTSLSTSSTWPASFGEYCDGTLGIRTAGRDVFTPYDDFASLYKPAAIGSRGNVTAKVLSIDAISAGSKAGVAIRNSLKANGNGSLNATGYAAVFVTAGQGVLFQYGANATGLLDTRQVVVGQKAPLWVRLAVQESTVSAYWSADGKAWSAVGQQVSIAGRGASSDAGVIATSGGGFKNGTAIFSSVSFGS